MGRDDSKGFLGQCVAPPGARNGLPGIQDALKTPETRFPATQGARNGPPGIHNAISRNSMKYSPNSPIQNAPHGFLEGDPVGSPLRFWRMGGAEWRRCESAGICRSSSAPASTSLVAHEAAQPRARTRLRLLDVCGRPILDSPGIGQPACGLH